MGVSVHAGQKEIHKINVCKNKHIKINVDFFERNKIKGSPDLYKVKSKT
jgi:hypothetical protein